MKKAAILLAVSLIAGYTNTTRAATPPSANVPQSASTPFATSNSSLDDDEFWNNLFAVWDIFEYRGLFGPPNPPPIPTPQDPFPICCTLPTAAN